MRLFKRLKKKAVYFTCPNCGAGVKQGRTACPECGSDSETGWKADAGLEQEIFDDYDYHEALGDEFGKKNDGSLRKIVLGAAALLVIAAFLINFIF
ncbi:MAG: zinc ribbon domain-containing protein [Fibrobacterota bacterium]